MSPADSNPEANQRYTRVAISLHWVTALGSVGPITER
jgi:cytochrome b561